MANILSSVTQFVNAAIGWISSFAELITATPLLLCFTIISLVSLAVGLLRRLMR